MIPVFLFALLITADHWRADIDQLAAQLEKLHPNLYFQVSREDLSLELKRLKSQVETLTDQEVAFRMQRAVALVGDAHTQVDIRRNPNTFFPLSLRQFGNDLVVVRTNEESKNACGTKLVAIDGIDVADVYARVATMISHENDAWLSVIVPQLLLRAEVLHFLGITSSTETARFTFETGGVRFDLDLAPLAMPFAAPPAPKYWWKYDESRHLMYVKYNVCAEDPAYPFATFTKEIFAVADSQQVDRFVIDIRNNLGGNSAVVQPVITALRQRPSLRGRLYAIIGRETFSSGVLCALDLRGVGAILVGEPTGGKPNSYGDVRTFALSWSGLTVYYSTKYFRTITNGDPSSLEPDMRVDLTMMDYFLDRDPVLDAILPAVAPSSIAPSRRRAALAPRCQ